MVKLYSQYPFEGKNVGSTPTIWHSLGGMMEPKIGDTVIVIEDIYIDYLLVPAGYYIVKDYSTGSNPVKITEGEYEYGCDDSEDDSCNVIELWKKETVSIEVNDGDNYISWWVPFAEEICYLKKILKPDKQLQLVF